MLSYVIALPKTDVFFQEHAFSHLPDDPLNIDHPDLFPLPSLHLIRPSEQSYETVKDLLLHPVVLLEGFPDRYRVDQGE